MNTFLLLFKAILCQLLCKFCECCEESEECPDGICVDLRAAVDELQSTGAPGLSAKLQLQSFSIDWAAIQAAIPKIIEAVKAITAIFGGARVG